MPIFLLLLGLFVGVPLLELALLIEVGGRIGALPTIALCLLTAAMGGILVRSQGGRVIATLKRQLDHGRLPVEEAFHGLCILAAGLLLLTPGFVTDAIGFALLVPPLRRLLYEFLRRRVEAGIVDLEEPPGRREPPVIDVDYEEIDEERPPRGRGWGGG